MTDADLDLGYDLTITKVTRHAAGSGDVPAADDLVATIVDFLCVGLADYAYGQ